MGKHKARAKEYQSRVLGQVFKVLAKATFVLMKPQSSFQILVPYSEQINYIQYQIMCYCLMRNIYQFLCNQPSTIFLLTNKNIFNLKQFRAISLIQYFLMSGFFSKIKDAFSSSKKVPKYKVYEAQQIKMVALKTRVILTQNMDKLLKHIYQQDQKFKFIGNDPKNIYTILQSIGEKVIEAQSMKIFIQMMRKVQNNSTNIAKTNGDISFLKTQLQWFQSVLWYRKAKQIKNIDDINKFCLDFFKGVDITTEMNIHCEVFTIYPILKYLKKNEALPLPEILFYLQPYVSCNIAKPTLDAIFEMNKEDIKMQTESSDKRQSLNQPKSMIKQASKPFANSAIFTVNQTSPYQIKQAYKPPNVTPSIIPNNNTYSHIPNNNSYSHIPNNNSIGNINNVSPFGNTGNVPYNQNHSGNTFNLPSSQFGFVPPNYNYFDSSINHNPFSTSSKFNTNNSNFNQPQQNNLSQINNFNQPQNNYQNNNQNSSYNHHNITPVIQEKKVEPNTIEAPKKSFFNSLMRANTQNKNVPIIPPENTLNVRFDNERQQNDFNFAQTNQSHIPLNQQTQFQGFKGFQPQNYEKQQQIQRRNRDAEEKRRKEEEQNKRKQQQAERMQQQIEGKRRQKLEFQRLQRQKQESERIQKEKERKQQQERELAERRAIQEKQRKERDEQLKRQIEQERLQRQREERMREQQRESQYQLNVFVDNQREDIDRGYSGRFSSNMGFKIDFADEEAEQFSHSKAQNLNSSLLRFKKVQQVPTIKVQNYQQTDENESLCIVDTIHSENKPFKLFYYRKMEH